MIDTVVKKLSDGKVVIRQALLKASSLIIKNNNPDEFLNIAINHLNDESWHVREGVVYLVANCKIVQSQNHELQNAEISQELN